jgi:hypothetical protein
MRRSNVPARPMGAATRQQERPQQQGIRPVSNSKDTLRVIPLGGIEEVGEKHDHLGIRR